MWAKFVQYRIRIKLQYVPIDQHPLHDELITDYNPWHGYKPKALRNHEAGQK